MSISLSSFLFFLIDRRERHLQAVIDMISASPTTYGLIHLAARTKDDLDDATLVRFMNSQQLQDDTNDDRLTDENGDKEEDDNHDQPMADQQQHIPTEEELQAVKAKEQERWALIKQQMVDAKKTNEVSINW